jgi:hypothetical protein
MTFSEQETHDARLVSTEHWTHLGNRPRGGRAPVWGGMHDIGVPCTEGVIASVVAEHDERVCLAKPRRIEPSQHRRTRLTYGVSRSHVGTSLGRSGKRPISSPPTLSGPVLLRHLEEALLGDAHLQRADFDGAQMQGAYLESAQLQDAYLPSSAGNRGSGGRPGSGSWDWSRTAQAAEGDRRISALTPPIEIVSLLRWRSPSFGILRLHRRSTRS